MIRQWAQDRNLIKGSNPERQMIKLIEEVEELAESISNNNRGEFIDAIGDCIVVLTIMAAQSGLDVEDCIDAAYDEIKDRRGRMVDGVFVKESQ